MSSGDLRNINRPRSEANQRLDSFDMEALSLAIREHADAKNRALISKPLAAAASPVGTIYTGGSLTGNPSGPSDGLVRLNTETFIGIDSDGRELVKPSGTTLQAAVPAGNNQVYAYFVEDPTELAVRRFASVNSPFSEVSRSVDTVYQATVGLHVRAGDETTIVPEDTVGGVTKALLFLGLASNTAGVVTVNVAHTLNRLSTVKQPSASPASSTTNGSMQSLEDMVRAIAYKLGMSTWRSSSVLTPAQANNFGAYNEIAGLGLDAAGRYVPEYITIGNGTTSFGRLDATSYANHTLLLQAAIDLIPTDGLGVIVFKHGLTLNNFSGTITIGTNNRSVIFVGAGWEQRTASAIPTIVHSHATPLFTINSTNARSHVSFRHMHIQSTVDQNMILIAGTGLGALTLEDTYLERNSSSTAKAMIEVDAAASGVLQNVYIRDCRFVMQGISSSIAVLLRNTITATRRLWFTGNYITNQSGGSPTRYIDLQKCREDIYINNNHFEQDASFAGTTVFMVTLRQDTAAIASNGRREVSGNLFKCRSTDTGVAAGGGCLDIITMADISVSKNTFLNAQRGVKFGTTDFSAGMGDGQVITQNLFCSINATNPTTCFGLCGVDDDTDGGISNTVVSQNVSLGAGMFVDIDHSNPTNIVRGLIVKDNIFYNCVAASTFQAAWIDAFRLANCAFDANLFIVENAPFSSTAALGFKIGNDNGGNGPQMYQCSLRDNTFTGQYHLTSQNSWYSLAIYAAGIDSLDISRNKFWFQNSAITNTSVNNAAFVPRVVEIGAGGASDALSVKHNQAMYLQNDVTIGSGLMNNGAWLYFSSGSVHHAVFEGNEIGTSFDLGVMGFVRFAVGTQAKFLRVHNNSCCMNVTRTSEFVYLHDMIEMTVPNNNNDCQLFDLVGNHLRFNSGAAVPAGLNYFSMLSGGASARINTVMICNNIFSHSGAGGLTNPNATLAITTPNLMITKNVAMRDTEASTTVLLGITLTGVSNYNATAGALPGAGVTLTENIKIKQQ